MCCGFFYDFFSERFLILRRIERDMMKNVYWSSCNEPSACGSALGLPPCRHDRFVFPFMVLRVRGFSRWPGQEQEAPSPVIFSEKATQTSGICFGVKFCFGLCISKLKFRLCFVTVPDVCLAFASGGAGTSFHPRR